MLILALEASTTSAKAMYFDTDSESCEVDKKPYPKSSGEAALLDPEAVFEQMARVGRELVRGRRVDIVALGGAWHSVGLFDRDMRPVTPIYQWDNTEPAGLCAILRGDAGYVSSYYRRTGCMVNATYAFFKLLMLKRRYELRRCYILGQGSYNNYRLTGRRIVTDCMLSGSGLLNIHTKKYDERCLEELGIDSSSLPQIVTYRDCFPLVPEAAARLGIRAGIPVMPACPDGALDQAGSGALAEGVMTCSIGTSCAIRLSADRPVLSESNATWCYLSPVSWLPGGATNCGTNNVDWFKQSVFETGMSYAQIEAKMHEGDDTPVYLPFLYGARCPGWNDARMGCFAGLRPSHDRYHMYRAVQEGVLFNIFQCYEALTGINGKPDTIRLSGGILNSAAWSRMCADIFQHDMEIDMNEQASLLGGVVLAKERLGLISDVRNARPAYSRIIHHDPQKATVYREKYQQYISYYDMISSENNKKAR